MRMWIRGVIVGVMGGVEIPYQRQHDQRGNGGDGVWVPWKPRCHNVGKSKKVNDIGHVVRTHFA